MGHNELWQQTALVAASSLLFVAITLFAFATTWAQTASDKRQGLSWWVSADVGTTILVVRILQGLLTVATSAAISSSFTQLHWREMHKEKGLRLADLLALSPTTTLPGTLRIILSRRSKVITRVWAIARTLFIVMPWLAGILLFARTSLITVFDTASVYDVTSGIGPFNSSYVGQFVDSLRDDPFAIIPYSYSSVVHNLITNSLFSTVTEPLRCQRSDRDLECASYILSGGLSLTAPWTPTGHSDHPLVRIGEVPTVQVEFQGRSGAKSFGINDCLLFGSNTTLIAAELCLAVAGGSMHAGIFICNGTAEGKCVAEDPMPNITTTMSFFRRQGTVLTARSNLTIMGLSDLSSPEPINVSGNDVTAYKSALSWLLDYAAANIPATSSIIEIFWSNQDSLSDSFIDGILLQNFRSILAFPVWLFNANNYGNTMLSNKILNPDLPAEFYTQAAVVAPLVKLQFNFTLLIVFMCLEGIVLVSLWIALLWLFLPPSFGATPTISPFPIFDALFKASIPKTFDPQREGLQKAKNSEILKKVGGTRIYADGGVRQRKRAG